MNEKILNKINDWRKQSLQLKELEKEIIELLPAGDSDYYSRIQLEGYHITKNDLAVLITHSENWESKFPLPETVVEYKSRASKSRAGKIGGAKSKGGGRNPKYATETERLEARREAVKRYRANQKK